MTQLLTEPNDTAKQFDAEAFARNLSQAMETGSQALATALGARVVPIAQRGYGAALIGGCHAAAGRHILMGDCDGSYDFTQGVAMVARLEQGFDLCMGSRFAQVVGTMKNFIPERMVRATGTMMR